jgi:hypothetical protein
MSNSYKKEPFVGNTTASTEKPNKKQASGAKRANFRTSSPSGLMDDGFQFNEKNIAHSNLNTHAKDGKHRLKRGVTRTYDPFNASNKSMRKQFKLLGK